MAQKKRITNPMAQLVRSNLYKPTTVPSKKRALTKHLRKQKKVWQKIIKEDLL